MVRVRFAPSPTGGLHIGGVRTALYNYLFARKNNGQFILRIEDTDQNRYVEGAEDYIMKALEWLGISADESPQRQGHFGPYRQSERLNIYKEYVQQLLDNGLAYYAFDTPEELEEMRRELQEAKASNQQYSAANRMQMRNSLTMPSEDVEKLIAAGSPYVVRIKLPSDEIIEVNDLIRGKVSVQTNTMDDKILMKSDGFPTYHLANIVDDHLMKITHVIRGEEWLPSAPLHVFLYRSFGWQAPQFAHLPLLLKPEGNGKLSKRDADRLGFPIFPLSWTGPKSNEVSEGFKEKGYLPETMVNFLALLGWNPGNEQEIFSLDELTKIFNLDRISKAGAKFDIQKANWLNEHYLRSMPTSKLAESFMALAKQEGYSCSMEKASSIVPLIIERCTFIQDLWNNGWYFFVVPNEYDDKTVRKKWTAEAVNVLKLFSSLIVKLNTPKSEAIKETLEKAATELDTGLGRVMPALRVALTGQGGGPDLMGIVEVLGVEETKKRIELAIDRLKV